MGVLQDAKQEVPQEIFKYPMVTKKKQSKVRLISWRYVSSCYVI